MSRRDNQFHNNDSRAWIEVMGRNLGGGVTLTIYAGNGAVRHGVRLCDHASVSLDATKLRGLAARLAREADTLAGDGAAASSAPPYKEDREMSDTPVCCFVDDSRIQCSALATVVICGESRHPEDVTESCDRHIGDLLGTPQWVEAENRSWTVVALDTGVSAHRPSSERGGE